MSQADADRMQREEYCQFFALSTRMRSCMEQLRNRFDAIKVTNERLHQNVLTRDKLQLKLVDSDSALSATTLAELAGGDKQQYLRKIVLLMALETTKLQDKLVDIEIEIRADRGLPMWDAYKMLKIEEEVILDSLQDFKIKVVLDQFNTWQAQYDQQYGPGPFFRPT